MSSTADTADGYETCFRCENRAHVIWECLPCRPHNQAGRAGPHALCRECAGEPCPECGSDDFKEETLSSLPQSPRTSFVTNFSLLEDRVREVLQGTDRGLSAHEIARECGLSRNPQTSEINQVLYALERRQVISTQARGRGLELWQLPNLPCAQSPRVSHSSPPLSTELETVDVKIRRVLETAPRPMTAIEIARACGLQRAGDVNPQLYKLKGEGLVRFQQEQGNVKPLWFRV